MLRPLIASLAGLVAIGAARSALAAPPGEACFSAYESAQSSKKSGQLVRARSELELCIGSCPTQLANDCKRWVAEVDAAVGELTVAVTGPGGGARVEVDGLLREAGAALALDPGPHTIRVEASGFSPVERKIEIARGAKKTETIALEPLAAIAEPVKVPALTEKRSVAPFVLGGVGLAAMAGGGVLSLVGWLDVHSMRASCAPAAGGSGCAQSRIDRVRTEWIAGSAIAGAGLAAVSTAAVWIAIRPGPARESARLGVGPGSVSLAGAF